MAKNIIKLNRGDSCEFTVNTNLSDNAVAYFVLLYPHQRFEDAIIIKGYDHTDHIIEHGANTGEILIKIEPKDTRQLTPGIYYYTVKLQKSGTPGVFDNRDEPAEIRTIIDRTKFIINE